jgi:6-pyruvoyltetrahydropterin/6-carboxytetrahydropterin synthase
LGGAWPATFDEFEVTCRGTPDPTLGYLVDIKEVDRAVHAVIVPILIREFHERHGADGPTCMREFTQALTNHLGSIFTRLVWKPTPYHAIEMNVECQSPGAVVIKERFEFAASHRLNVPSLSAEENRRVFGKCNHASGHGHNYIVEPSVAVRPDSTGFSFQALEQIVKVTILDRFDHTYLNVDTPEFRDGEGVNPTVENIARVFHRLLAPAIGATGSATLASVTVWESERTSATFPG